MLSALSRIEKLFFFVPHLTLCQSHLQLGQPDAGLHENQTPKYKLQNKNKKFKKRSMLPSFSVGKGVPSSANAAASSAKSGSSSDGTELTEDVRLGDVLRTFFQDG